MKDDVATLDHSALIMACADGDQQALRQLYDREGARLLGVVQRIVGDRALAEDIIHDAFVRIWTRADTFDASRGSGKTWMFSVARHLAINHVRSRHREVTVDEATADHLDAEHAQDAAHEAQERFEWQGHGDLDRCLSELDVERRNCLFHAYVDGFSHQEIATRMDRPLGTVKAWIKRSLASLRECLS